LSVVFPGSIATRLPALPRTFPGFKENDALADRVALPFFFFPIDLKKLSITENLGWAARYPTSLSHLDVVNLTRGQVPNFFYLLPIAQFVFFEVELPNILPKPLREVLLCIFGDGERDDFRRGAFLPCFFPQPFSNVVDFQLDTLTSKRWSFSLLDKYAGRFPLLNKMNLSRCYSFLCLICLICSLALIFSRRWTRFLRSRSPQFLSLSPCGRESLSPLAHAPFFFSFGTV